MCHRSPEPSLFVAALRFQFIEKRILVYQFIIIFGRQEDSKENLFVVLYLAAYILKYLAAALLD